MTRYANIVDNRIVGFFEGPEDYLTPLTVVAANDALEVGDIYRNGVFIRPRPFEPTAEQIAEKLELLRSAIREVTKHHLDKIEKEFDISFENPKTDAELDFYTTCKDLEEKALETVKNPQDVFDYKDSLPNYEAK